MPKTYAMPSLNRGSLSAKITGSRQDASSGNDYVIMPPELYPDFSFMNSMIALKL